ncbi:AAA family ATPase [Providencia rettgeri]|uniref:AAA family ATPase n=1 Tax=Providencia rettgeri TaxID=587 RepID=UPI00227171BB|nr:AAA family ATPase [Providencia rettgeri]MCX9115988.1 ATP-dependent helicase [Providencia rettgeri]
MDKQVIFAVAGSGKTETIIRDIDLDSRCLIITYTIPNSVNIKERIIKKLKTIPKGVKVYTFFGFLYSFCYKPIIKPDIYIKGVFWTESARNFTKGKNKNDHAYYIDKYSNVFSSRFSMLMVELKYIEEITDRIEKYFDHLLIDEVQDIAANDFNFICEISKNIKIKQSFVGDFYQHTFDSSKDGMTNKNLHANYEKYKLRFKKLGLNIDTKSLFASWRCSPSICSFITEKLKIEMKSHRQDVTNVIYIDDLDKVEEIYTNNSIVKLFYRECYKYKGNTENWGKSKGLDCYIDVCVVLNDTTLKHFLSDSLHELTPDTKNKLYVACTRAKRHLYFVSQKNINKINKSAIK